jgi:ABC-2 type transport system permease protein
MIRRTTSLARSELLLLLRNKVAMAAVVGVPLFGAVVLAGASAEGASAARSIGILIAFLLLFVVYYNLLSAYVARRDDLVLKRLRTGECTDAEILAGTAAPSVVTALVQVALLVGAGALLLDLPFPVNAPLLVLAVLLGAVVFVGLALLTAPWTRTIESVQITSLPVVAVCGLGAGVAVPLDVLPDAVAAAAALLPLSPVVHLVQLAWLGSVDGGPALDLAGTTAAAAGPLAVASVWVALSVVAALRWFRWEPRR